MSRLAWSPIVIAVLGGAVFLDGSRHLRRRRIYRGGVGVLPGVVLVLMGLCAGLVSLNIATYARLTYERPVAEVSVKALDPDPATKRYAVAVRLLDGSDRTEDCTIPGVSPTRPSRSCVPILTSIDREPRPKIGRIRPSSA